MFLGCTSTGRVGLCLRWFYVQELLKAQQAVVLVLINLTDEARIYEKYISTLWNIYFWFKEIYLSKALTCMKIFLHKQELLFCQGDRHFWPDCCMNNLYISHRSLCAPTYNFWAIRSMLISLFRVTSWFDTVNNAVTRWINFRENHLHEHVLQLFHYNI